MVVNKEGTVRSDAPPLLRPGYIAAADLLQDLEREIAPREGGFFGPTAVTERPIDPTRRKIAFAVSGGGAAGAYSAGSIEALSGRMKERGLRPDILVGTSSGALNCYGVFLEALGKHNRQLCADPILKQPFSTFIASIWSYLDRDRKASSWIVGRRAWMVDIGARGLTPLRRWGLAAAALLAVFIFNPFLFTALFLWAGADAFLPDFIRDWSGGEAEAAWRLAALGAASLTGLALMAFAFVRLFGRSLFRDVPLLRLLANAGDGGDLSRPRFWSAAETEDRARVVSRDVVRAWYQQSETAPELIITATDITVGRECLFTLVRPETYRRLVERGWMAVQLDAQSEQAAAYRDVPNALFTLPENLLRCVVSSTAVPSAFPAQEIGIYGANGRKDVRHRFFDGGVINNSPIHLAIDSGATHIISFELDPLRSKEPLEIDDRGVDYNILEAGVTTFTALLDRASERDIRRTVTWNRFLASHPEALNDQGRWFKRKAGPPEEEKRIILLYRIAPAEKELGTVEFDGRWSGGRPSASIRDVLRRGLVDLKGPHIWRATLQSTPIEAGHENQAPPK